MTTKCRLEFSFDPDVTETDWVFGTPQILRTLDTHLDLTEISGSVTGTSAEVLVTIANSDGASHNVYLRHRAFPMAAWTNVPLPFEANSTLARFPVEDLTGNAIHEFEASLDQNFLQETTLTLYLFSWRSVHHTFAK